LGHSTKKTFKMYRIKRSTVVTVLKCTSRTIGRSRNSANVEWMFIIFLPMPEQ